MNVGAPIGLNPSRYYDLARITMLVLLTMTLMTSGLAVAERAVTCTTIADTDEYHLSVCVNTLRGTPIYTSHEIVGAGMGGGSNTNSVRVITKAEYYRWIAKKTCRDNATTPKEKRACSD